MKPCIDSFFEESARMFRTVSSRQERFLTDAEIEELLRDLPGQVIYFRLETPRTHSKIA